MLLLFTISTKLMFIHPARNCDYNNKKDVIHLRVHMVNEV